MDLDYFRKAVESVILSPCRIGIMGGEPTLHPKFGEILDIYAILVPISRREFWTAGFAWGKYEKQIKTVFRPDRIAYNDHMSYDGKHAPLLVAIDDVVADPELKAQLIENCPYQSHWSASITPKGGFFCEIAASLDWLFDGPGGYDISDLRWWDKLPCAFQDQVREYCGKCSGAIPMPEFSDGRGGRDIGSPDIVSRSNLERLRARGSRKIERGDFQLWETPIDHEFVRTYAERNPRAFRSFVAHTPEDTACGGCNKRL
jgi:hypothetical protein